MMITLTPEQSAALKAYLAASEDAEMLSEGEWVLDLYDLERPVSIDLLFEKKGGLRIEGAAELLYDQEQDGWYMGNRLEDAEEVRRALIRAGALPE